MQLAQGTRLGHYQIEQVLGTGGMGIVYRAFDGRLERPVAIKFIQQMGGPDAARRLLSEARSASALNHPNICTVYEVADLGDRHFIVMELVDGRPLSDVLVDALPPPEAALGIAAQVASALAHAHERGVVHGDLKCANVLLGNRGQVKVVDFGLARRQRNDETLTDHGAAGTPYAMAPEQVAGEPVGPTADVWALGVLLQELISGTRPFAGATPGALFAAILRDAPLPLPPGVSPGVRGIVERCLMRDAAQRFQHGGEVVDAIERLTGPALAAGRQGGRQPDSRIPLPPALAASRSSRIVLIGREEEWSALQGAWDRARDGRRQLVLIAGEAGIGKTRLTTEFARTVADNATVLLGRCDQEALVPQQPFVEALDWYARECPPALLQQQLAGVDGLAELAALVSPLKRAASTLDAVESNPEGRRYRLFEAVASFVKRIATERPLLLLLEDLHWADRPTALLLRHLLRSSHEAPLCLVGTYRETDVERGHPFAEVLADLRREEGVTRITLQGLSGPDVQAFIGQWIGKTSPTALTDLVAGSTEGNPFFVGEVMQHLSETGLLSRIDSASASGSLLDLGGLPDGVRETIARRLGRLSEECNRVLALASVLGREFSIATLAALADVAEDRVLDRLDEALVAGLVQDVPRAPDRYTFTHALVRDALYEELTPARRSRLHRQAAEAIDRLSAGGERPLADLAHHYAHAGTAADAERAIVCALGAAERAASTFALEEAARFYGLALHALDRLPQNAAREARRLELHLQRGRAYADLGLWNTARPELDAALRLVEPGDTARRTEVLLDLSRCSFWGLDTAAVKRFAPQAMALAESLGRRDLIADAMSWIGAAFNADGDPPAAVELDRRAMAFTGGPTTFGLARTVVSLYHVGLIDESVARGLEAVEHARAARDPYFLTCALEQLALPLVSAGRYGEASRAFVEMRDVGRRHGVLPMLARGIAMSAGMHLTLGDYARGEELAQEARDLARRISFMPAFVSAGIDLLMIYARSQEPGRAEDLIGEVSASTVAAGGWHGWLWRLRLSEARAELHLARGEWPEAIAAASDCITSSEARSRPKYVALGLIARAQANHMSGARSEALADISRAADVADALGDPAVRLKAMRVRLQIDGSDRLLAEANAVRESILAGIDQPDLRSRFLARDAQP